MSLLSLNLDEFKMGDFILWENTGGLGNLIRDHQLKMGYTPEQARYVHIDVAGGGQWAVRVSPPFTKVVDIRNTYKNRNFILMRLNAAEENPRDWAQIAFWAASNCNRPYSFWDLLRFKLPFLPNNPLMFFCSENACWATQKEFPGTFNYLHPSNCPPAEFFNPNFLYEVCRGTIN